MIELGAIDHVDPPTPRTRLSAIHLPVAIGLIVLTIAMLWLFISASPTTQGEQIDGPRATTLRLPEPDGWIALTSETERPGFPEPMAWTSDGVCVGFGRIDFSPVPADRRPSLARCRTGNTNATMGPHVIRPLVTVVSGHDTWHFLETADPVEDVRVQFDDGDRLETDRAYIGGSIIALRLENGRDLVSFGWATTESTYRCTPDPMAWESSVFCIDG